MLCCCGFMYNAYVFAVFGKFVCEPPHENEKKREINFLAIQQSTGVEA